MEMSQDLHEDTVFYLRTTKLSQSKTIELFTKINEFISNLKQSDLSENIPREIIFTKPTKESGASHTVYLNNLAPSQKEVQKELSLSVVNTNDPNNDSQNTRFHYDDIYEPSPSKKVKKYNPFQPSNENSPLKHSSRMTENSERKQSDDSLYQNSQSFSLPSDDSDCQLLSLHKERNQGRRSILGRGQNSRIIDIESDCDENASLNSIINEKVLNRLNHKRVSKKRAFLEENYGKKAIKKIIETSSMISLDLKNIPTEIPENFGSRIMIYIPDTFPDSETSSIISESYQIKKKQVEKETPDKKNCPSIERGRIEVKKLNKFSNTIDDNESSETRTSPILISSPNAESFSQSNMNKASISGRLIDLKKELGQPKRSILIRPLP